MTTFKILLCGLLLTTAVGCEKYLDLEPISDETVDAGYKTAGQIEAALTGTYESFQNQYYQWDKVLYQDVRSDNHYAGGDNPEIYELDFQQATATNSRLFSAWSDLYNAIAKANLVLEKTPLVDDIALTEERQNQIMGEAYFLRAYHYYNLVNLFGSIPLITEFVSIDNPDDLIPAQASKTAVYDQIIADVDLAVSLLPDTYGSDASTNKARATAGAANALGVKASLQRPNPDHQAALDYAEAVEASAAGYILIDYNDLFDGNNYNSAESILEGQFIAGSDGSWGPQLHLPPSISGDGWRKFVTPSHDLIDAFDAEGDLIRKNATVLFESVSWVDEYWGNAVNSSVPFAYKMKHADGWSSSDRLHHLRLGDILLLKAEALAGLGRLGDAAAEVNRIRTRAQLDDLPASASASEEAMMTAILNERRLELAQEGQRWDDLVRHGKAVVVMGALSEIDLRTGSSVDYSITSADLYFPIPQTELDRNPNLTQN